MLTVDNIVDIYTNLQINNRGNNTFTIYILIMDIKMKNKIDSLKKYGCLNKSPDKVKEALFKENDFFDPYDLLQVKYEMLRKVSRNKKSIREATKAFGFSRPSFYKANQSFEKDGLTGLISKKTGPQKASKLNDKIMIFINELIKTNTGIRAPKIAEKIFNEFRIKVHPRSIERAISRQKKTRDDLKNKEGR